MQPLDSPKHYFTSSVLSREGGAVGLRIMLDGPELYELYFSASATTESNGLSMQDRPIALYPDQASLPTTTPSANAWQDAPRATTRPSMKKGDSVDVFARADVPSLTVRISARRLDSRRTLTFSLRPLEGPQTGGDSTPPTEAT